MALWQYSFLLLPKESKELIAEHHYNRNSNIEEFDDSIFWQDFPVPISVFNPLADILPIEKSWSNEILQFGLLEFNCIEVLFKDNLVVSVSGRIDFTRQYDYVLRAIIEFCILNGFILVDETLSPLNMNFEDIKRTIENSDQSSNYRRLGG